MKISVVIPTHNRASILQECLNRLLKQTIEGFEVIVVDDGSTDNTVDVLNKTSHKSGKPYTLKHIHQSASHQAVARNRGVEMASGELIVFIDDDILAEPDFLERHLTAHKEHQQENIVVLGFTTWDKDNIEVNDYMRFLEASGWQFGYGFLTPGFVAKEPYKYSYTANLSMKKNFFMRERFDEDFCVYGWEDAELAYRLWKNHGMRLFYEPRAVGWHRNFIAEDFLKKKMNNIGYSAVHFSRLHPEVGVVPSGLKGLAIKTATNRLFVSMARFIDKDFYYKLLSWREFFVGVAEARKKM